MLNLEFCDDVEAAISALGHISRRARRTFGILLDGASLDLLGAILRQKLDGLAVVLLTTSIADDSVLARSVDQIHESKLEARAVITSVDDASRAQGAGFDGLVAKGNEAAGWVGEETAFVLGRRPIGRTQLPVWLQGGIGLHTAGAALAFPASRASFWIASYFWPKRVELAKSLALA